MPNYTKIFGAATVTMGSAYMFFQQTRDQEGNGPSKAEIKESEQNY